MYETVSTGSDISRLNTQKQNKNSTRKDSKFSRYKVKTQFNRIVKKVYYQCFFHYLGIE